MRVRRVLHLCENSAGTKMCERGVLGARISGGCCQIRGEIEARAALGIDAQRKMVVHS